MGNFTGLPFFAEKLVQRMDNCPKLKCFKPVEICNLEYDRDRGACIEPHKDDSWSQMQ